MRKKPIRLGCFVSIAFVLLVCCLYLKYEDYTCHGCMRVGALKKVAEENAFAALYISPQLVDTIYLAQGLMQGYGCQYYSKGYFIGYSGEMDKAVSSIQAHKILAHYRNGKNTGLTMTSEIPKEVHLLDHQNDTLYTYGLDRIFPDNIASGSKPSIFNAWLEILR